MDKDKRRRLTLAKERALCETAKDTEEQRVAQAVALSNILDEA